MLRRLITRILIIAIIACMALIAGSKGNFAVFWIALLIGWVMPAMLLTSAIVGTLDGDKDAFDVSFEIIALVIAFIVFNLVYTVYDTEADKAMLNWMFRNEPGPIAWDLESKEEETTDTEDETAETAESEVESTTNETKETNTETTTSE